VRPSALTIAGLDPSGGAGLAADLRTFDRLGVHGAAVATLWTVQGSGGVRAVFPLAVEEVTAQLDEVLGDLALGAAKTGALGRAEVVEAVALRFAGPGRPALVVDPVLVPTAGQPLADDACAAAIARALLPVATLVTPNRVELARLSGRAVESDGEVEDACRALVDLGARAVLAKGGHGSGERAVDVLFDGDRFERFDGPRARTAGPLHGAGCALSAAIAARLALGDPLAPAVRRAKAHVADAIARARPLGRAGDLWVLD
jgi:hydroxymethylpyrimidine/phosphomethylpyrimidine kinase